jgi:hypothetical protein
MEAYNGAAAADERSMINMLATFFSDQCVCGAVTKFENQIMAASELFRTISSTHTAEVVSSL